MDPDVFSRTNQDPVSERESLFSFSNRLYWRGNSETTFHEIDTEVTTHMLENLSPNSQYIVYVIAISKNGQSSPSETLIAWTDPAFPAFVEVSDTAVELNYFKSSPTLMARIGLGPVGAPWVGLLLNSKGCPGLRVSSAYKGLAQSSVIRITLGIELVCWGNTISL